MNLVERLPLLSSNPFSRFLDKIDQFSRISSDKSQKLFRHKGEVYHFDDVFSITVSKIQEVCDHDLGRFRVDKFISVLKKRNRFKHPCNKYFFYVKYCQRSRKFLFSIRYVEPKPYDISRGYDSSKKGFLYILEMLSEFNPTLYKFGISNYPIKRIKQHISNWSKFNQMIEYKPGWVTIFSHKDGGLIREIENRIKKIYPTDIPAEMNDLPGYTELRFMDPMVKILKSLKECKNEFSDYCKRLSKPRFQ